MPKSRTQLTNLCIKYRGTVLDECSSLEKFIETFICIFFTLGGHRAVTMLEVLLDRFHFDGKIAVFESLIKKSAGGDFKKKYGKLFGELRYIKDERNKFAHYVQHIDKESEYVILINFRDSQTHVTYTPESFKLLIKRIERCSLEIKKINENVHEFLNAQYSASSAT